MVDVSIYLAETVLELLGSFCIALTGFKSLRKDLKYKITQLFATGIFLLSITFFVGIFIVLDSLDVISVSTFIFNVLRATAIMCIYLSAFFFVLTGKSLKYGEQSLLSRRNIIYFFILVVLYLIEILFIFSPGGTAVAISVVILLLAAGVFSIYLIIFLYDIINIYYTLSDETDPRKNIRQTIKFYVISLLGLAFITLVGWSTFSLFTSAYTLLIPTGGIAVFGALFYVFTGRK